jgi:DNA-binding Lrp family transcriptional regulator
LTALKTPEGELCAMANELQVLAWRTKLGNSTAKNVLAFVCDSANGSDGCCFPSDGYIAQMTEISERTVARMIEVFEEIGLIKRFKIKRNGKTIRALEVAIPRLGTDLHAEFEEAYARAQGKAGFGPRICRSDSENDVAATQNSVAATEKDVAATVPPHPHKGGTVSEPPLNQTLNPKPKPAGARVPGEPDVSCAVSAAMRGCGLRPGDKPLRAALREVVMRRAAAGQPPELAAAAMVAAWREFTALGEERLRFSAMRFFGEGIWLDRAAWRPAARGAPALRDVPGPGSFARSKTPWRDMCSADLIAHIEAKHARGEPLDEMEAGVIREGET